jgi:hypothetical protein
MVINFAKKDFIMISNNECTAIAQLDLDPIKVKLMHKESGEGWSLERASAVEVEYRRFLSLMKMFPNEQTAPLIDVDTFWHYHILDTMKYAADCEMAFGYFLHHFPYVGMRGEDDAAEQQRAGSRMQELYEATFGEPYGGRLGSSAWCGASKQAGGTAWCGASKQAGGTAWCGASKQAGGTAWCGASKQAGGTAWCGASKQAGGTAWCGASKQTGGTAWCGASKQAGGTAWCGASTQAADTVLEAKTTWRGRQLSVTTKQDGQFYSVRPALAKAA